MNPIRSVLSVLTTLVSVAVSIPCGAEDIDIYSGNASSGVPNVLFVMDNAANFSANAATCIYSTAAGGGVPTLNGTAGGVEQCALVDAIASLPDTGTVNIGLMAYNAGNFTDGAAAGVGPCVGSGGGCLLKPLTLMDTVGKAALMNFVKTWKASGSTDSTSFVIKTNNEATGSTMQEAWAYYNGKIGMSGKNYATSITGSGCQKNFIIFVGNAFDAAGKPGDASQDPANGTTGLASAQVGATAGQRATITAAVKFPTTTCSATMCGTTTDLAQAPVGNVNCSNAEYNEYTGNYADEWARFMYQKDTSTSRQGVQNITTYTIGVIDNNACKPTFPALLTNMAEYGGGKYYQTGNADDVRNAILKILNEVQAVNSVFASSSLPVSVNAQGTYLNQIYMGMFRPEETANPRWVGNLKQYAFIADLNGNLSLGDAIGQSALSSSGKGFLSPNAVSYWTCSNTNNSYLTTTLTAAQRALLPACPGNNDPDGGFWKNFPTLAQSAGGPYDLSDGELVEKGGVAQQIRLAYRDVTAATYTASGGTRKLYTYCPSGASCVGNLTDATNAFTATNTDITAAMFGASTRYKVTSIVRTGTTAVVTTLGNHGYATGNTITIENATDQAYNVTTAITVTGDTTFTISGLPDYPTTPTLGVYTVATHNSSALNVTSITRTSDSSAVGRNSETATVTTSAAHGYANGTVVSIAGATPADFGGTKTVANAGVFTFDVSVPIYPTATAVNTYTVSRQPGTTLTLSTIIQSGGSNPVATSSVAHGLSVGDSVIISSTQTRYNGTRAILTVPTATTFTFAKDSGNVPASLTGATAVPVPAAYAIGGLTRTGTGSTATATATGITASKFSNGNQVNIVKTGGASTSETAYVGTFVISCSGTCTSFTYTIPVTPGALAATGTMNVAIPGASVTVAAGNITRSGTTATVSGLAANAFANGQFVDIGTSGTVYPNESAYTAAPSTGWQITCSGTCTSFIFGPVTQTPASPAAGAQILAYSASTPPDKTSLINWVRGQDNFGDETGPGTVDGTLITMRPSLHGDVLHSRPMVINYGDPTGVVVFYGTNGGVFHAINGNQVNPSGSTLPAPGNELWGFVPTELFGKLSRQRINDPDLKLPTTPAEILPAPQKKDYFIDGPTGIYQLFNSAGATTKAILYLTMRRGGQFLYAVDVTDPAVPTVLWKKDTSSLPELGQTWSTPKVFRVKGRTGPVVAFAAGYDTAQDAEPPTIADSMGRGIYVLDAVSGDLVWSATYGASTACATTGTMSVTAGSRACTDSTMKFAMPSDLTLIDKDRDGYIDRMYVGDLGGNVWRVDLEPSSSSKLADTWQVNRIASLGCFSSECPAPSPTSTTAPRKIFFPPEMISTSSYDAVFVVTGDREHPLDADTSSQRVNRVFMLQDKHTGNDVLATPVQSLIRPTDLYDGTDCSAATVVSPCSSQITPKVEYAGQSPGYYIRLSNGEKGVNAPLVIAGSVYFGTSVPKPVNTALCTSNLGEARGYRLFPFTAAYGYTVFESEGLPPSPVAGVVRVNVPYLKPDGTYGTKAKNVPFAIGVGSGHTTPGTNTPVDPTTPPCTGADCKSAFGGQKPPISVPTTRTKNYWYTEGK